jgi:predicted RNA-binding protein associated with RNAse of E/G family
VKRLLANRPDWKRILQKRFYCSYFESKEFTGYATLLCLDKVREPLWAKSSKKKICIVDNNYSWLQFFPKDKNYAMTAQFNEHGQIVQWYIEICLQHGITENNIPWLDDLFLDIVVFPTGEIELLDFEELQNAFVVAEISKNEYDLAISESKKLMTEISENKFALFNLCQSHRQELLQTVEVL